MEIKLNLTREDCLKLLRQNGYDMIDNVLGYYYLDSRMSDQIHNKKSYYIVCVYKSNNKPEILSEQEPSIHELEKHSFENIVRELVNERLVNLLLKEK